MHGAADSTAHPCADASTLTTIVDRPALIGDSQPMRELKETIRTILDAEATMTDAAPPTVLELSLKAIWLSKSSAIRAIMRVHWR